MVFLLFVVSLLLSLGGGAAALYGADTIRTETGSTLAVAGVAMTCAGLLMFALAGCLAELRKIRRLVEAGDARPPVAQPPVPAVDAPILVPATATATAAAVAAAVVAADRAPAEPAAISPRAEPELPPAERAAEPGTGTDGGGEAVSVRPPGSMAPEGAGPSGREPHSPSMPVPDTDERKVPEGTWDPERPAHVPAGLETTDGEAAGDPGSGAGEGGSPKVAAPSPDDMARPEPAEPASQPPGERELVATYASGENTYFMYSDNTIEAETPNGRFRFSSMDDLRVFVETGEGGMPLTPPPPRQPG